MAARTTQKARTASSERRVSNTARRKAKKIEGTPRLTTPLQTGESQGTRKLSDALPLCIIDVRAVIDERGNELIRVLDVTE